MNDKKSDQLDILGITVNRVDEAQSLARIATFLKTSGCKHIITLNPEYVMNANKDEGLRRIINSAELTVPDGMGVVWASRILGEPLLGRVTGTDLLPHICRFCAEKGHSIYFLGGQPGIAGQAASKMGSLFPKLKVAGFSSNDPDPHLDDHTVAEINDSKADLLAVAYGCPKQDFWIDRNRGRLTTVRVAIGVGGAFDFISSELPRAPGWMRQLGLEWLFRLWMEPSRIWRMLALPLFGLRVFGQRWGKRG